MKGKGLRDESSSPTLLREPMVMSVDRLAQEVKQPLALRLGIAGKSP